MKKLLLLARHAEAELPSAMQADADRDLTNRGLAGAARLGVRLQELGFRPDYVVCSPARRTHHTANLLSERLDFDLEAVVTTPLLLEPPMRGYLQTLNELEERWAQVLLVAHNPNVSYLAEFLTQSPVGSLPPAGLVAIEFSDLPWAAVSGGTGKVLWQEFPASASSDSQ